MGILRLLLALTVLIGHSGMLFHYNIANSEIAVTSFFIISGFYMALILDKKYIGKNATFLFLSNRFLRIFPVYWLTLLVLLIFASLKFYLHIGVEDNAITHYINNSSHTSPFVFDFTLLNYILRNLTLIISTDYFIISDKTPGYLFVQQAWTLQIELLFYLTAPFLMKLSKKLFLTFFFFYILIFFGFIIPLQLLKPTLIYTFLTYFIFFLAGIISYKFIYQNLQKKKIAYRLEVAIFLLFILYLLLYNYLPFPVINQFIFSIVLTCALPFIFKVTKSNIIDTILGKLSYPVYITHYLIIKLLSNSPFFRDNSDLKTILVIIFTLFVSFLIIKFLEDPIDHLRQQRLKSKMRRK